MDLLSGWLLSSQLLGPGPPPGGRHPCVGSVLRHRCGPFAESCGPDKRAEAQVSPEYLVFSKFPLVVAEVHLAIIIRTTALAPKGEMPVGAHCNQIDYMSLK